MFYFVYLFIYLGFFSQHTAKEEENFFIDQSTGTFHGTTETNADNPFTQYF